MQENIHPESGAVLVKCGCGNEFHIQSVLFADYKNKKKDEQFLHVDVCSDCHPFYTGKQKIVDSAGRVERFKRKYGYSKPESREEAQGKA